MSTFYTRSGAAANKGTASVYLNSYYYATDENKYYLATTVSGSASWVEQNASDIVDPAKRNVDGTFRAPDGALFNRSGSIGAGGTSQAVTADNTNRKYLLVQNISNADMYLGIGFTPTVGTGLFLAKNGGIIVWDKFVPTAAINIICNTSNSVFTALEG